MGIIIPIRIYNSYVLCGNNVEKTLIWLFFYLNQLTEICPLIKKAEPPFFYLDFNKGFSVDVL